MSDGRTRGAVVGSLLHTVSFQLCNTTNGYSTLNPSGQKFTLLVKSLASPEQGSVRRSFTVSALNLGKEDEVLAQESIHNTVEKVLQGSI